jgi:hypothetical protein
MPRFTLRRLYNCLLLLTASPIWCWSFGNMSLPNGSVLIGIDITMDDVTIYGFRSLPPNPKQGTILHRFPGTHFLTSVHARLGGGFEGVLTGDKTEPMLAQFNSSGDLIHSIQLPDPPDGEDIRCVATSSDGAWLAIILRTSTPQPIEGPSVNGYSQGFTQPASKATPRSIDVQKDELHVIDVASLKSTPDKISASLTYSGYISPACWHPKKNTLFLCNEDHNLIEFDPIQNQSTRLCRGYNPELVPNSIYLLLFDDDWHYFYWDFENRLRVNLPISPKIYKLGIQEIASLPGGDGLFIVAGGTIGWGSGFGLYDNAVTYWWVSLKDGKSKKLGLGRRISSPFHIISGNP